MEVSPLVDGPTVGVVRVAEVVDVVGVADTLGAAEVVVRGADVVDVVGVGVTDVIDVVGVGVTDVIDVVGVGATDVVAVVRGADVVDVVGVVDVVVEVSLASCSRSFPRFALASARARSAFSTCRRAKMRSFVLRAFFSACSAFFNVASASATMRSPSSTVEGFGGATYSGATM